MDHGAVGAQAQYGNVLPGRFCVDLYYSVPVASAISQVCVVVGHFLVLCVTADVSVAGPVSSYVVNADHVFWRGHQCVAGLER